MNPIQIRAVRCGLVLALLAMMSAGNANERDMENCTANHNIKAKIRISACTRILRAAEPFGNFGKIAALSNRASAYFQTGRYHRALSDLNVAVGHLEKLGTKVDEEVAGRMIAAGIYGNRGIILLALGRQSDAMCDFKKALSIEPIVIERYKEVLRQLDKFD